MDFDLASGVSEDVDGDVVDHLRFREGGQGEDQKGEEAGQGFHVWSLFHTHGG